MVNYDLVELFTFTFTIEKGKVKKLPDPLPKNAIEEPEPKADNADDERI